MDEFKARRSLDLCIQVMHSQLHPNQPPHHTRCSRCLGMKGKGWAKRLETNVFVLPRRARR